MNRKSTIEYNKSLYERSIPCQFHIYCAQYLPCIALEATTSNPG